MKRTAVLSAAGMLALASVIPQRTPANSKDIASALTALNVTLQQATMNHDAATLADLITDDFQVVTAEGTVYNRSAFLTAVADRSVEFELNEPEDVVVRDFGDDCGIVTAILHFRLKYHGQTVDKRVRFCDVWVKINGRWRYAYGSASPYKTA